ncbi:hypothetical protein scyTo_0014116 [Scyliorhinus torazame]|uniref:Uncharacterized protein n=1 Tax=Scyliorhinus torazame TaxID=75743 RepID=A0A401NH26_SCYTO|nr:hypothetical protein [Scyliorhinus torazame]
MPYRLQMKRSSQEATTAQEGRKGWVYEETEENESISSFEAQVVDPETQDNPNNKCCPRVTPVFMTENMEESQEAVQGKIQLSDGGSLGSVHSIDGPEKWKKKKTLKKFLQSRSCSIFQPPDLWPSH